MNPNEPNQQQLKGAGPPRRMCNVAAMSFQLCQLSPKVCNSLAKDQLLEAMQI